jgi:hypothetical protein
MKLSLHSIRYTSIENLTLAHFRHFSSLFANLRAYKALYNCRESSTNQPFYAKQTQSQVRSNQRKLFYNKQICESGHLVKSEKQTQTNPILSAVGGFSNRIKLMQSVYLQRIMTMLPPSCSEKQTQTNPIFYPLV